MNGINLHSERIKPVNSCSSYSVRVASSQDDLMCKIYPCGPNPRDPIPQSGLSKCFSRTGNRQFQGGNHARERVVQACDPGKKLKCRMKMVQSGEFHNKSYELGLMKVCCFKLFFMLIFTIWENLGKILKCRMKMVPAHNF